MTKDSQLITIAGLEHVRGGLAAGYGPDVNTPDLGPLGAPGPEFGEFSPIKPVRPARPTPTKPVLRPIVHVR